MQAELNYTIPRMSCCGSCEATITEEVQEVAGVEQIEIDLETKRLTVRGDVDDAAVRAAISEAGYEAA